MAISKNLNNMCLQFNPDHQESNFVKSGRYVFLPIHYGIIDENKNYLDNIITQTKMTMINIQKTLEYAGSSLDNIIKTNIYLKNFRDFKKMNEIYRKYILKEPLSSINIITDFLDDRCLVQIELIAFETE